MYFSLNLAMNLTLKSLPLWGGAQRYPEDRSIFLIPRAPSLVPSTWWPPQTSLSGLNGLQHLLTRALSLLPTQLGPDQQKGTTWRAPSQFIKKILAENNAVGPSINEALSSTSNIVQKQIPRASAQAMHVAAPSQCRSRPTVGPSNSNFGL